MILSGIESRNSGSLKNFFEVTSRLVQLGHSVTVLTSEAGAIAIRRTGLKVQFWTVNIGEAENPSVLRSIMMMSCALIRTSAVLMKARTPHKTVLLAMSDLLWDTFPLAFAKQANYVRVTPLHMVYPPPTRGYLGAFSNKIRIPTPREIFAYLQFQLSIAGMKRHSDFIFAQSNLEHYLLRRHFPAERIIPFTPSVEFDLIDSISEQSKKYDAFWIGRWHPMKGCYDLIKIWDLVRRDRPDSKLAIIGNAESRFRPLVRKLRLDENVEFLGAVDNKTKFQIIKSSRLFLTPSYYESWGHSILESLACGVPVVAYDLAVYATIYPSGLVKVPIGDKMSFYKRVEELLNNNELRAELGIEAKIAAQKYVDGYDLAVRRLSSEVQRLARVSEIQAPHIPDYG